MSIASKIIKKNALAFLRKVKVFCEEKKIDFSLRSFLHHKTDENQYLPDSYRLLLSNFPIMFLSNSKTFDEYYYGLDKDIRQDIILEDKIIKARAVVFADKDLNECLKKMLNTDYIYR